MFKKKNTTKLNQVNIEALTFLTFQYQHINIERLKHLDTLGLNLHNKKVLDLGAGIGDHSLYYLLKNCKVKPIEGRNNLVEFIKSRLNLDAECIDFEKDLDSLSRFKNYDIVHCFGLLYHLNNPREFLEVASKTGELFLLETMVSNEKDDNINLIAEDPKNSTQAISGIGCRPNREWLFNTMKSLFEYVYIPITQPKHPQFPNDWSNLAKDTSHSRIIFIGSHIKLNSDLLTQDFFLKHK